MECRLTCPSLNPGIPRLSESELIQLTHISWSTWEEIRKTARGTRPGIGVNISGRDKRRNPRAVRLPEDLFAEAARLMPLP